MASRVAQWAFAAFYLVIAIIAIWGGVHELNPGAPAPNDFDPNPLPYLVNSGMVFTAAMNFLTAVAFGAVGALTVRDALRQRPGGLSTGLNLAFAAFLGLVGAQLVILGGQLLMLGGSFYYALAGLALLATAALLVLRRPLAALVYAGVVAFTVLWSILESGLDFIALLPRLAAWLVVGLWFLAPWYRAAMAPTAAGADAPKRALWQPNGPGGRWVGFASLAGVALLVLGALQGYAVVEGTKNAAPTAAAVTDWRFYGGVAEGQRFAQLDQINVENVGKLTKAWEFRTEVPYDFKQTPQMANGMVYICTAGNTLIAVDSDTGKQVWRYDTQSKVPGGSGIGRNGKPLTLGDASTFARSCRGLGYHEAPAGYVGECAKRIITGTTDARLIAVDAITGEPCHSFGFDGVVNLTSGLGRSPPGNYMVTSTPLIAGDKVVVGGWVTDNQQLGNPSGVIRAFDTQTGKLVWAWDMGKPGMHGLPDEGAEYTRGTPNSWTNASYDPQLNLIYIGTGNASPDYFDGDLRSKESEEHSSSIIAIDGATGDARWTYQTVHRDIWDWDVPSQPVLVNIRKNGEGEPIPAVAAPTKRGEIFLLDRRTGVPIYDTPEKDVPQNPAPGEVVAKTQPFSPLPHFRDDRVEKDMWGMTPLDQLACRIEFKKMRYDGHFTPPMPGGGGWGQKDATWGGTFQYPGNAGGFNWGSVSVDADNGLLIAAPMLMGNRITLTSLEQRAADRKLTADRRAEQAKQLAAQAPKDQGPEAPGNPEEQRRPGAGGGGGQGGGFGGGQDPRFDQNRVLYTAPTSPFMSDWKLPIPFLNVPTDLPCFEPPYGQIGVIDLNTNKLLWKRPFGTMKNSGPFGIETGLPFMVGTPLQAGSMTTRGGLIFHGGAMDATIRAFDVRTGAVKWESPLPGSAHATPMSYMGKNGKQYVLIAVTTPSWRYPRPAAGEADKPDPRGGYVIAYALPDAAK